MNAKNQINSSIPVDRTPTCDRHRRTQTRIQGHSIQRASIVSRSKNQFGYGHLTGNTYGRRAFSVAGPMAWNSLPDFIRDPTNSTDCFRRILKTYLFARYWIMVVQAVVKPLYNRIRQNSSTAVANIRVATFYCDLRTLLCHIVQIIRSHGSARVL